MQAAGTNLSDLNKLMNILSDGTSINPANTIDVAVIGPNIEKIV